MVPKYSPLYRRPRSWNPRPWGYNPRGCTPKIGPGPGQRPRAPPQKRPRHAGPPALPSRPQRQTQPDTGPRSESPHSGGSPARPCRDMQKPRRTGKTVPKVPQRSKRATAETRCSAARAPVSTTATAPWAPVQEKEPSRPEKQPVLGQDDASVPIGGDPEDEHREKKQAVRPGSTPPAWQESAAWTGLASYRLSCRRSLEEGFNFPPGGADAALDKMGLPTAPPPERLVQSLYKGL